MEMEDVRTSPHYTGLRTAIALSGGETEIISVLYQDPAVIDPVCRFLTADLPGYTTIPLDMTASGVNPDTVFRQASETVAAEKRTCLFHLTGIEALPEERRFDILGYLQDFRQRHIECPSVILLWITPSFEKLLFYAIPDIYHQTAGVYDFSPVLTPEFTPGPADSATADGRPAAPVDNIVGYLREVIRQYENWESVRKSGETFLIGAMGQADLHKDYLPTCFSNSRGKTFLLDNLLKVFLENRTINFLSFLGETGAGKTSFLLYYYIHLSRAYIEQPESHRIPLFISLKGHTGRLNPEALIAEMLERQVGIQLPPLRLQDMLLMGKFVFFIDGFDEMGAAGDFGITRSNLDALARLAVKNILIEDGVESPQPANKVFLACVPHYFLTDVRKQDILKAGYTPLYRPYAARENYQIVRMDPRIPDENQIRTFVTRRTSGSIAARNLLAILNDDYIINSLASRELISILIMRTVNDHRNRREINAADLYRAFTDLWIERDDWRFRLLPSGRRNLMHQMAVKMFTKGEGRFLPSADLVPPPIEGVKDGRVEADMSHREIQTCPFVLSDEQGNYRFAHASFYAYFVAAYYYETIRAGRERPFPSTHLDEEIIVFLRLIVAADKDRLHGLDMSELNLSRANLYQADLSEARMNKSLMSDAVLISASLAGADLTAADLEGARLLRADLRNADLSGVNLSGATLRGADLTNARLNGANLLRADLRDVRLRGARMAWADLREADLSGADLAEANLTDADLSGADLTRANLNETDLSGANLTRAVLAEAELIDARLTHADLTRADLTSANFKWATLTGANFTLARLFKAKFREADLKRANLDDAVCGQGDFRGAEITGARLREGQFQEANFSEADLSRTRFTGADLTWANLNKTDLRESDLSDAHLNMSKLREAKLIQANLNRTDLTWADLTRADLSEADLEGANLSEADLTEAILRRANLGGANFKGANLRDADLREADCSKVNFESADLTGARLNS